MSLEDWPQVAEIYRQGLQTGNASLETEVPAFGTWDEAHIKECRFVAALGWVVVGWGALTPVSNRCVYGGVAEVSIYISEEYRGQRVGRTLLGALVEASEKEGFWTLQSGIHEENTASVALHHRCGFKTVGLRERLGRDRKGKWRNIFLLERRSNKVGLD
jgi:phosphinothricin acetyltransferase